MQHIDSVDAIQPAELKIRTLHHGIFTLTMNIIIGIIVDTNICRKRSNGTHFSRAHVAQLLSDNSKLWDVVSVNSDLSALDLEQSQVTSRYVRSCVCL